MQASLSHLLLLATPGLAVRLSPGCGAEIPHQPHPGGSHNKQVELVDPVMGEVTRHYRLHIPLHYDTTNISPVPLLLDYHGWSGTANSHENDGHDFFKVADEDTEGGFLIASGSGMGDGGTDHQWGSWNCSTTVGPLGEVCVLPRGKNETFGKTHCYDSCGSCDPHNSCDWTSCYDDILYTEAVIDQVANLFCVDLDSVHQTGMSNGGMFSYFLASRTDRLASIGPTAGAPLLGFGDVPISPISVIDFHGLNDRHIPYNLTHAHGEGPHGTVISSDGYYYHQKAEVISRWAEGMECGASQPWPTHMDGAKGWQCTIRSGCIGGAEVVSCTGEYGHNYPFGHDGEGFIEGSRIMWKFMKEHPRQ